MQIIELLQLGAWCKTCIESQGIVGKYSALYSKINQNIRRNSNLQNSFVPFEAEKDILFESIKNITFQSLSLEQIKFLDRIGIVNLLGNDGISRIEDILFKNQLDIITATARIKSLVDIITQAVTTINELSTVLSKSFSIEEDNGICDGDVLVRVYFKEGVAINNLTDFKTYSNLWYEIGRGVAMAQNKTADDFKIIGASKGSIIISMAIAVGIATSISRILLEALKVADKVLDIRKKCEEIKKLKLENKKIAEELNREADKTKEEGIKSILNIIVKKLGLKNEGEGDKINALEKSVKDLIDFTEKGGIVDFVQSKEDVDKNVREKTHKLNKNIDEIRVLENKMKVIEKQ
ncbi:hypothetical protein FACS189456_1230 [Bacteroidia bacterium]|nr:hypothetical protein FACS189456_1230 [Bacteroidia bacterium]